MKRTDVSAVLHVACHTIKLIQCLLIYYGNHYYRNKLVNFDSWKNVSLDILCTMFVFIAPCIIKILFPNISFMWPTWLMCLLMLDTHLTPRKYGGLNETLNANLQSSSLKNSLGQKFNMGFRSLNRSLSRTWQRSRPKKFRQR